MTIIKPLVLIPILFASLGWHSGEKQNYTQGSKWVVHDNSTLCIDGKSNINKFNCEVKDYCSYDTIAFLRPRDGKDYGFVPMKGSLKINIEKFTCHDLIITHDFRKTLNYKTYPYMNVQFCHIEDFDPHKGSQVLKGRIRVNLANKSKDYDVELVMVQNETKKVLHLIGNKSLKLSDFGLKPVSKLGGLVKVEDELRVNFFLILGLIGPY